MVVDGTQASFGIIDERRSRQLHPFTGEIGLAQRMLV